MIKSSTAVKARIKNKAGGDSDKSQIILVNKRVVDSGKSRNSLLDICKKQGKFLCCKRCNRCVSII